MEKHIEALKKSPIFALTLGSKELCHSNYWAWLIETDNKFAKVFFDNLDSGITNVDREKEHMDLVLETPHGDYIIENKLKSLPDKEQLEKYYAVYNEKHKTKFVKGIICGIVEPSFKIPQGWNFLSYADIAEKIEKIKNSTALKDDAILNEYIRVIKNIHSVLNDYTKKVGQTLDSKNFEPLSEIKLDDIAKKLKADEFVKYLNKNIRNQIENKIKNKLWKLEIYPGFSNKSAFVDIRLIKDKDTTNEMAIGVQIQAGKFERDVLTKQKIDADSLFHQFKSLNWFSDYKNQKTFLGKPTSQNKNYCSYKTDAYIHLYQYYNIQNYSFYHLAKEIVNHLTYASKIINENNL